MKPTEKSLSNWGRTRTPYNSGVITSMNVSNHQPWTLQPVIKPANTDAKIKPLAQQIPPCNPLGPELGRLSYFLIFFVELGGWSLTGRPRVGQRRGARAVG